MGPVYGLLLFHATPCETAAALARCGALAGLHPGIESPHTYIGHCKGLVVSMIWFLLLVLLFAAALAGLWLLLLRAKRRLLRLEQQIATMGRELQAADSELAGLLSEVGGSRIVVEVLNPLVLARENSRLAGALSGVAPRMVRRRVYSEVASEMKRVLADDHGVDARVEIFHPTGA